jgi:hypothetical protein
MKFGVREICEVVLKAKAAMKVGNKVFYKDEPVIYFDTLKTSSMEGAATTVYAQGGRGNSRLVAWEGERTVTFSMEDALISPEGFMILSGAGLVEASESKPLYQHHVEQTDMFGAGRDGDELELGQVALSHKPYLPDNKNGNFAYVMLMKNGEIISEPYIPVHADVEADEEGRFIIQIDGHDEYVKKEDEYVVSGEVDSLADMLQKADAVLVDYYEEKVEHATQIEITPDKFGGNFYLEAETLFRTQNGVDLPAIFTIPNCKIQSNFTFTMASSGDPSTFNFVMDAFPDYTRFDHSKKVLATIQMFDTAGSLDLVRKATDSENAEDFDWKLFD